MKQLYEKMKNKDNGFGFVAYIFVLILIVKYSDLIWVGFVDMLVALKPLFIGFALAYFLNVFMRKIEKTLLKITKKKLRGLSIAITCVLFLLAIFAVSSLIIPQIKETVQNIASHSSDFEKTYVKVATYLKQTFNLEIPTNVAGITTELTNSLNAIGKKTLVYASSFASGSLTAFIGFVIALYLLASKERLEIQKSRLLGAFCSKENANKSIEFINKVDKIFSNYIAGMIVDALILAILIGCMMTILNFPYAFLIATLAGILAIIPIFGNIIAMVIGAFLIFAVDPLEALYFVIAYQVVQQFENNVIYPKIVGAYVGLPGVWTLLAVSAAGTLFGAFGMIVAVPVASVGYILISEYTNNKLIEKKTELNDKGYFS